MKVTIFASRYGEGVSKFPKEFKDSVAHALKNNEYLEKVEKYLSDYFETRVKLIKICATNRVTLTFTGVGVVVCIYIE